MKGPSALRLTAHHPAASRAALSVVSVLAMVGTGLLALGTGATAAVGEGESGAGRRTGSVAASGPMSCAAATPLPCASIARALPYVLEFETGAGGLAARPAGGPVIGTGFTMVMPSSRGSLKPARLAVRPGGTGTLVMRSTAGTPLRVPGAIAGANALDNGLGIGIDARSRVISVSARLASLPRASGRGEQAGVWFGLGQNDYVAAAVTSVRDHRYRTTLTRETGGVVTTISGPVFGAAGILVTVELRFDPRTGRVSAIQALRGKQRTVATLAMPGKLLGGNALTAAIPRTTIFAGILATHRANPGVGQAGMPFVFDRFAVRGTSVRQPTQPGPTQPPTPTAAPRPTPTPTATPTPTPTLTPTAVPVQPLTILNADGLPFRDRLVFNRIRYPHDGQPFHNRGQVRLTNPNPVALTVEALTVSPGFALVTPPALPLSLAAGASVEVDVAFTADVQGVTEGTLTVDVADGGPDAVIELAGFRQQQSEGVHEPALGQIVDVFGWDTTLPVQLNRYGAYRAEGPDEVLAPFWTRVDASKPVTVTQVAAFHTWPNWARGDWYARESPGSLRQVLVHDGQDAQSLLPRRSVGTGAPASGSFAPTGEFGLKLDTAWSDPRRNNNSADRVNGCTATQCGHHIRAFLLRDRAGVVIPDSYLLGMDYNSVNYDYQDNVYVITNVRPVGLP